MTLFEQIAAGTIPCHKVWESDTHLAFLDIHPLVDGHTLVIPKTNVGDELLELPASDLDALMHAAQDVGRLLKQRTAADRIIVWVEGFEVPHVHVHLLPATRGMGIRTLTPKDATQEELAAIARRLTN